MRYFIVRGIVGCGKTAVAQLITELVDGKRLSTDNARLEIQFDDSVKLGQAFRKDDAFQNQQRFVYDLLLALAERPTDEPGKVADELIEKSSYIKFSDGEQKRLRMFITRRIREQRPAIILDGTFSRPEQLRRFRDELPPKLAIVDVQASDAVIRTRLVNRVGESRAALNIYEAMLPAYKSAKDLGFHSHVINNDGTFEELKKNVEKLINEVAACTFCHDRHG
jgi:predicted kinase